MYAADYDWWVSPSGQRALAEFQGRKWTCNPEASEKLGINHVPHQSGVGIGDGFVFGGNPEGGGNGGFQAVNLALQWGYDCILVGFTMQEMDGRKHWHPDHKNANPNQSLFRQWVAGFNQLAPLAKGRIKIHGESAITAYERTPLVPPCEGVLAVLKSGGWPTPEYAQRLCNALPESVNFRLLTDMEVDGVECLPLEHGWPGWWSKMECFRLPGDHLYTDLDVIVLGDVTPYMVQRPAMLGDFYRPKLESGLMYLTAPMKRLVWERWISDPPRWMSEFRGDGDFIRDTVGPMCMDLRDVGGIHSFKVQGRQPDTRLLVYHGEPRPADTPFWERYEA